MSTAETEVNEFKPLYKAHRYWKKQDVIDEDNVLSFSSEGSPKLNSEKYTVFQSDKIEAQNQVVNDYIDSEQVDSGSKMSPVYSIKELPGLKLIPSFIQPAVQKKIVKDTIEKYVPASEHLSNLDVHYHIPRPFKIFDDSQPALIHRHFPEKKRPLPMSDIRNKKLRWITLGGQYNWTEKVYPTFSRDSELFPSFPAHLANLFTGLFPNIVPEAAVINFYSPTDILLAHQDVAEKSSADLISLSIGCSCVFYIGETKSNQPLSIILNSGDVLIMGGESRTAFHGVGKVWENTCPQDLIDDDNFYYGNWLQKKRINLNVRQMLEH